MTEKELVIWRAEILEADFHEKTITFRLPKGFEVVAGEYVIALPKMESTK